MIDVSQLAEYSFADIAKAAKVAMMNAAVGGSMMSIHGRSIGRITPAEARALYDFAMAQLALEDDASPAGLALVQWGERC